MAAAGRRRLRASDADRERAVELVKAAFVQGRLVKDEFDARVGQVLTSRTYAELDAVITGLPAGVTAVQPPSKRLGAYRARSAIGPYRRALADQERTHGRDHPDTIVARANLAFAYRSAGRLREAVPAYERTLADRERVQGRGHQDTVTARANLAACYQLARRLTEAIPAYQRTGRQ
jgi:tetratricopeptide (TPR) repeat protein